MEDKREELVEDIRELEQVKSKFGEAYTLNNSLKEEIEVYVQKINEYEKKMTELRTMSRPGVVCAVPDNRDREEQLESEVRNLRREVDEANFRCDKLSKEAEFNLELVRKEHQT